MIANNPNATVAIVAGSVTTLAVYGVGFAGVEPPAEVAAAFTTVVLAVILWVGRRTGTTP